MEKTWLQIISEARDKMGAAKAKAAHMESVMHMAGNDTVSGEFGVIRFQLGWADTLIDDALKLHLGTDKGE